MSGARTERRFVYRARAPSGAIENETLWARDRQDALKRLSQRSLVVTELRDAESEPQSGLRAAERILVLRQLAVMTAAGVELLDALEAIADPQAPAALRRGLDIAVHKLRQGERVASALEAGVPGYPPYVYALVAAGEASGKLPRVLKEASAQLILEDRLRRDVTNALTYPALLLTAGAGAVAFMMTAVVPRFADMLRSQPAEATGAAGVVLAMSDAVRTYGWAMLGAVILIAVLAVAAWRRPQTRGAVLSALAKLPLARGLILARARATWARVMSLATGAGVGVLEAANLARAAVAHGPLDTTLAKAVADLRDGREIDVAFAPAFERADRSLLRAGQRSGALPEMFAVIAERHEDDLRDALKRLTALVEPAAIAIVALAIGAVVLSLVTAMTGIYDTIG